MFRELFAFVLCILFMFSLCKLFRFEWIKLSIGVVLPCIFVSTSRVQL